MVSNVLFKIQVFGLTAQKLYKKRKEKAFIRIYNCGKDGFRSCLFKYSMATYDLTTYVYGP